jgi:hypothetical protein
MWEYKPLLINTTNTGTTKFIDWKEKIDLCSKNEKSDIKDGGENMFIAEEDKKAKHLFNVILVKNDKILIDKKVVAYDTEDAKFVAGVYRKIDENGLKPSDVTIIVYQLGAVKETKKD